MSASRNCHMICEPQGPVHRGIKRTHVQDVIDSTQLQLDHMVNIGARRNLSAGLLVPSGN